MEGPAMAIYFAYYWNMDGDDDDHFGLNAHPSKGTDLLSYIANRARSISRAVGHIGGGRLVLRPNNALGR
jgi:hypothetical protein